MKNVYIKLLILTMMLLCNTIAEAYTITGQIVDKESGTPLRKAVIIARNDSSKVLAGLNSDQNGQFTTANIDCQNVVLEISRENYKTTYFAVSNETAGVIDIGKILLERKTIELQEVEVNAQSVIQKPDRYLIFPSAKEIARSASSLSLLNELKMKMPGTACQRDAGISDHRKPQSGIPDKRQGSVVFKNPNHKQRQCIAH